MVGVASSNLATETNSSHGVTQVTPTVARWENAANNSDVRYQFTMVEDCLRAEMIGRETVEETQEFIAAVADEARKARSPRILISVRRSRPIFRVEQYRISEQFRVLAANPGVRVALVADTDELRAAHGYIEVLAGQHGARVRAFREEPAAIEWLKAASLTQSVQSQEKR